VDCSHANSNKNHELQTLVMENVANQIVEGNKSIIGLMVESNIGAGSQSIPANLCDLKYGVSVTDACIDWETTERTLHKMRNTIKDVLANRTKS
jgi:3-deoxy-7-phosphoheptulonate synthase